MFSPIVKESSPYPNKYYEKIILAISDMVASGELKAGDVLPSERELAELFDTSRVPVREALKVLEFLGLVHYIPGTGMVVRRIEVSTLLSKVFFGLNITGDTMEHLMQIRLLMEPFAAAQAAAQATEEDLAWLRRAVYSPDGLSPTDQSLDFHAAVIHASHNQLLEELYKFLQSLLVSMRDETSLDERYEKDPFQFHKEIYAAICAKQSVTAECLMRAHLEGEKDQLKLRQKTSS